MRPMMPSLHWPLAVLQGGNFQGEHLLHRKGGGLWREHYYGCLWFIHLRLEKKLRDKEWCCSEFPRSKLQNNEWGVGGGGKASLALLQWLSLPREWMARRATNASQNFGITGNRILFWHQRPFSNWETSPWDAHVSIMGFLKGSQFVTYWLIFIVSLTK